MTSSTTGYERCVLYVKREMKKMLSCGEVKGPTLDNLKNPYHRVQRCLAIRSFYTKPITIERCLKAVPINNNMEILIYLQILFGVTYSFPTISNDIQPVCEEDLSNKGEKYSQFYNCTLSWKKNVKCKSV